ncbi:hypothetical protein SJAG_04649 [Schizosaccharomyces japonicus yFS275]|uniref:Uncharacterized protein n=1 Tax=Schizosaccharomyces japonicus (strain yFS275 / FY16936) TaxID=402676 RepID=B6K7E0_SCHJY|nr:hypothetical protein SJAG_04649 [Schizosaccharomyces japonicus yFS275]EEB09444.1 hypothetical protein SJAG_04649 [Schizosaccharomyces japonicus yFS275]
MGEIDFCKLYPEDWNNLTGNSGLLKRFKAYSIASPTELWATNCDFLKNSYSFLKRCCADPSLDAVSQVSCFDATSVWLLRVSNACKDDSGLKSKLWGHIDKEFWDLLFALPSTRASLPGATGIQVSLKDMFLKALHLYTVLVPTEKECYDYLSGLLKKALSWDRHTKITCSIIQIIAKRTTARLVFEFQPDFISRSLRLLRDYAYAQAISTTVISVLVQRFKELQDELGSENVEDEWMQLWCPDVLTEFFSNDTKIRNNISSHLVPSLLRTSSGVTNKFLMALRNYDGPGVHLKNEACLFALKIAKDANLISQLDLNGRHAFVSQMFKHRNVKVQLACFRLVALCPNISRPLTVQEYDCIEANISFAFSVSDADSRQVLFQSMQDFLVRIRASCHALHRELKSRYGKPLPNAQQLIERAKEFLASLVARCRINLHPTSSYQQVITSLTLINYLLEFGLDSNVTPSSLRPSQHSFPFHITVFDRQLVRVYVDRLKDSYDDVRSLSLKTLLSLEELVGLSLKEDLLTISKRGITLLDSGRFYESDGGAKAVYLCTHFLSKVDKSYFVNFTRAMQERLQSNLNVAESNFLEAATMYPLQGSLIQLTYALKKLDKTEVSLHSSAWKSLLAALLLSIEKIWACTRDVLCNDSPEGNFAGFTADIDSQFVTASTPAQLVLTYAWRSIKEAAALLVTLLTKAFPVVFDNLDVAIYQKYGLLLQDWLCEIRHRGAFASVYPYFVEYCSFLFKNNSNDLVQLPRPWLRRNLEILKEKSAFITRRSGGIPLCIVAILVAEDNSISTLFKETMEYLLDLANSEASPEDINNGHLELPQVHGMNTLKAIFTEHKLSAMSITYIEPAFTLAIEKFSSSLWPIRNCCVMLFTALINRAFGNKKPKNVINSGNTKGLSTKMFFQKFPSLYIYLLKALQQSVLELNEKGTASTGLYPILNLFSRLQYAQRYENEAAWDGDKDFKPLLIQCSASRIGKVREIGAIALTCFVNPQLLDAHVLELLKNLNFNSQNSTHGTILAVKALLDCNGQILTNPQFVSKFYSTVVERLLNLFPEIMSPNVSYFSKRVFLEMVDEHFLSANVSTNELEQLRYRVLSYCRDALSQRKAAHNPCRANIGLSLYEECAAEVLLNDIKRRSSQLQSEEITQIIALLLQSDFYEVRLATLGFISSTIKQPAFILENAITDSIVTLAKPGVWSILRAPAIKLISHLDSGSLRSIMQVSCEEVIAEIKSNKCVEVCESLLVLLGSLVYLQWLDKADNAVSVVSSWFKLLFEHADEYKSYSSRLAALNSLMKFDISSQTESAEAQNVLSPYYLLLHDFLNDDSERIRSTASLHVQQMLHLDNICLHVANERWKEVTAKNREYATFKSLVNTRIIQHDGLYSAEEQLDYVLADDATLFRRERQNLFYSGYQRLEDSLSFASKNDGELHRWCSEGLNTLLTKFSSFGVDGPLGLTSDPDVWYVVYRIIRVADFLGLDLSPVHLLMRRLNAHPDFCD